MASRDIERCRWFIDECQQHVSFDPPPHAFGSYAGLLADDAVDAVYIPLPTAIRNLAGTKGSIQVPDFVLPRYGAELAFDVSNPIYNITGCDFNMEEHTRRCAVREYSNNAENAQETNMVRRFAELVLSSQRDDSWGQMSLKTQQVLDSCLQSARSGGRVIDMPA